MWKRWHLFKAENMVSVLFNGISSIATNIKLVSTKKQKNVDHFTYYFISTIHKDKQFEDCPVVGLSLTCMTKVSGAELRRLWRQYSPLFPQHPFLPHYISAIKVCGKNLNFLCERMTFVLFYGSPRVWTLNWQSLCSNIWVTWIF